MHRTTTTSTRQQMRRTVAAVGAAGLLTVGLGALPAGAEVNDDGTVSIDLLGINDFHGRIGQELNSADEVTQAGAVALASAVEDIRDANDDTVLVSAGDNFGASTFVSMINDDVPTLEILNELELAVSALGNHEFDQGLDTLWDRIDGRDATEDDPAWPALDFPYLGANVEAPGDRQFEDYYVHEVTNPAGDPVSVGFVGILTEAMPSLVAPSGIEGMEFTDMTEAATRVADQLTDGDDANGEADVVVVLVHEGASTAAGVTDPGNDFGAFVEGVADNGNVDAIFSGHTHASYEVEVERGDATPMPVVQTGSFGDALGQITLDYDPETGAVVAASTELIDLAGYPVLEGNDIVGAVSDIVADAEAEAEVLGAVPVGTVPADLNRARQSDGTENRGGESTIGNLIADAQLWAAERNQPDDAPVVAFMNPGGIRADIQGDEDGTVTYQQVATAQPFGNTLVTLDLTGAQIVQVLEEQWQPEGASRPFLKLGLSAGLYYMYDPNPEDGDHITRVYLDGEELDEDATYKVVTNSFLASGGDNFATFAEGADVADSGLVDLQAFVDFFDAQDVVQAPLDQRSIGVHWHTDQAVAHAPGSEISFDLSSLSFSTDEPKPQALELILLDPETEREVELGTVEVDSSIVDGTDEVGRADIRVTIPEIEGIEGTEHWELLALSDEIGLWFDIYLTADEEPSPTPTPTAEPTTEEPTTEEPTAAPTTPGGQLPDTGAETSAPLIGGALLIGLGALLMAAVRRRGALIQ